VNGNCQMTWIGRVFQDGEDGFATISDSGSLCTSLIRDVVNLLLVEMKDDGFIDRAWEGELDKTAGQCDSSTDSQDDDSGQLTIQAMGGTFILQFGLTAVAICISLFTKYYTTNKSVREQTSQKSVAEQSVERDAQKVEVGSDDNDDGFDKVDTQESYRKALRNQKQKMNEALELMKAIQSESDAIYERMQSEPTLQFQNVTSDWHEMLISAGSGDQLTRVPLMTGWSRQPLIMHCIAVLHLHLTYSGAYCTAKE
jgi:hypothetical protein